MSAGLAKETLKRVTADGLQQVERPPSLTAMITDQIRDLIITDQLSMGEQLSENRLAERLGVSRTPVREACLQLQSEHLLEVRPQRGVFVFTTSVEQIRDICELREVIETASLRRGMKRHPERLLTALEAALEAGSAVMGSPGDYQPTDHDFHSAFVQSTDNQELIEAYRGVSGRVRALRYRYARTPEEVRCSQADHERMATMLRSGDIDGALAALSSHVYGSLRNVERIIAKISD